MCGTFKFFFLCAALPSQHTASLFSTSSNPAGVHQEARIKTRRKQKGRELITAAYNAAEEMVLKNSPKAPSLLLLPISQSSSGSRSVQMTTSTHFEACDCTFSRQGCAKLIDSFFSFLLSKFGWAKFTWIKYKQKENSHWFRKFVLWFFGKEHSVCSLQNQYKQSLGTDTVLCRYLTLNYLSVILQD